MQKKLIGHLDEILSFVHSLHETVNRKLLIFWIISVYNNQIVVVNQKKNLQWDSSNTFAMRHVILKKHSNETL